MTKQAKNLGPFHRKKKLLEHLCRFKSCVLQLGKFTVRKLLVFFIACATSKSSARILQKDSAIISVLICTCTMHRDVNFVEPMLSQIIEENFLHEPEAMKVSRDPISDDFTRARRSDRDSQMTVHFPVLQEQRVTVATESVLVIGKKVKRFSRLHMRHFSHSRCTSVMFTLYFCAFSFHLCTTSFRRS